MLDGQTGLLAIPGDAESSARAIDGIDALDLDPSHAVRNAERLSATVFHRRVSAEVKRAVHTNSGHLGSYGGASFKGQR